MKKDSIKKIGAIALALVLSTSAVFITSCSDDDEVIDNSSFTSDEISQGWSLKNGTLTIINDSAMKDYNYYSNHAPWYGEKENINEVVIKNGVTKIRRYAFYECKSITQITIPDGVTNIGEGAFSDCSSLTQITIPDGVTSIGKNAFFDCDGLTQITIPDSVTSIGEGAFYYCESLTQITIPDGVTSIGKNAFSYCTKLQTINVSSGNANYTSIDGVLFNKDKTTLVAYPYGKGTSYTIPDGVTSIGKNAFSFCENLTQITIPDGVTSIGYSAFSFCKSLTQITIPDSVTSIDNWAFSLCTKLQTINFSGSEEQWNQITKGIDWDNSTGGKYTLKFGA